MHRIATIAATVGIIAAAAFAAPAAQAAAKDCPNRGTVRFGVEPFEAAAKLVPIYGHIGDLIGKKLDCKVEVFIATNYTAEIEAMRAGKLEIGEFGPLGYVLAHKVAHAEAVAAYSDKDGKPVTYTAGIVTWPGSGITTLKDVAGKSFGFSDPASTSGFLFPSYALKKIGIDSKTGVKPLYAGSHTASFEALRNHKVEAGELNSEMITSATISAIYKPGDFVELWRSQPIPNDPIAVRGSLPAAFKARLVKVLQSLDLTELSENDRKIVSAEGPTTVPQTDAAYDPIRDMVSTLGIDLSKLPE
jgi:phosphonate transport system substrate-binding protein